MFILAAFNDAFSPVKKAQQDEKYLNQFILENKRFIKSSASRATGRFITESDDEWSVALIAFHEAVRSYDDTKGNFKSFAALVIKRRLTDYMISQSRHQSEISLEPETMDGNVEDETASPLELEVRSKSAEISEVQESTAIKDEIEAVQQLLARYGFSFFDLTECSPKAEKTRSVCAKAVATLLKNPELFQKMRDSGSLPMKELLRISGLSRKVVERHRKYIIAAAEIMNGEYPLLKDYMEYIREAVE